MKTIAETLGVARSNLIKRMVRPSQKRSPDPCRRYRTGIRYPAFGRSAADLLYRRIAALLKRERRSAGLAPVKRVYLLMKKHGLLLQRHRGGDTPRAHDGTIATIRSNVR